MSNNNTIEKEVTLGLKKLKIKDWIILGLLFFSFMLIGYTVSITNNYNVLVDMVAQCVEASSPLALP